jgi:hypothetical protein
MSNQEIPAWSAILGLVMLSILCLFTGDSRILNFAFPAGAFAVGVFLYWRYPILYLGFNWWLWFLSPLLARLVEYQNNWTEPNLRLIILAPYLVTMLTALSCFKYFPGLFRLAFTGIFYSLCVGLLKFNPTPDLIRDSLSWFSGVFLGSHLLANWQYYPYYRRNTQRVFCWGVLVMGLYGIVQYITAPAWDQFWLKNAEKLQLCCGWPEPFMMRVWSTLNYPFTFAYVMMAGLLLLLSYPGPLNIFSIGSGFVSFLLSLVRGAWMGWCIGLFMFFVLLKPNHKARFFGITLVIGFMLSLLFTLGLFGTVDSIPFSESITSRIQSLGDIQADHSANERAEIYSELVNSAVSEVIGRGMGGEGIIDAGLLDLVATLGWFGMIPYGGSILLIIFNLLQNTKTRFDPFVDAAYAIVFSLVATLPFNNTLVLLPGVLFWGFAGMAMAAHKYYRYQEYTAQVFLAPLPAE